MTALRREMMWLRASTRVAEPPLTVLVVCGLGGHLFPCEGAGLFQTKWCHVAWETWFSYVAQGGEGGFREVTEELKVRCSPGRGRDQGVRWTRCDTHLGPGGGPAVLAAPRAGPLEASPPHQTQLPQRLPWSLDSVRRSHWGGAVRPGCLRLWYRRLCLHHHRPLAELNILSPFININKYIYCQSNEFTDNCKRIQISPTLKNKIEAYLS